MDRLNQWLTLFANVGVLAGIVFLAYEINQNSQLMQAQIYNDRASTAAGFWLTVADSEQLSPLFAKMQSGGDMRETFAEFGEDERFQVRAAHVALIRTFDNVHQQYVMGLITPGFYETQLMPGLRYYAPLWESLFQGRYGSPAFNAEIERILAEQ